MNNMPFRILSWRDLETPVSALRFVGTRTASRLRNLGITTIRDLLWHLPWRYEQYEAQTQGAEFTKGQKVTMRGQVLSIKNRFIFPRRMTVTTAHIANGGSGVRAVWFNQPYLADTLTEGTVVSLAGTMRQDKHGMYLASPVYERLQAGQDLVHTEGNVAVYPETAGITSKYLRTLIRPLLEGLRLEDPLPGDIRTAEKLPEITHTMQSVHAPQENQDAERARRRLAFDELLLLQLRALTARRQVAQQKACAIAFDRDRIKAFLDQLPFLLTQDQKVAAWEILKDIQKSYPMNRLLEGDVGSGKTVVALTAALQTALAGHQTVLMAPTDVLAQQHYATALQMFAHHEVTLGLLTASRTEINGQPVKRPRLKQEIRRGTVSIIIGTHAVIQKDVTFGDLALVVVDEQHRFGISQRAALVKGTAIAPHLLSMTATPIPRTLALTIFGDLDISLLRQKPKHYRPITTRVTMPAKRTEVYAFVREQVRQGRQVFIICPKIEPGQPSTMQTQPQLIRQEVAAVEQEYQRLSTDIFPDLRVGMLHGRLKAQEKRDRMDRFRAGQIDVLVSTSVIEVGVDVPNATVMIIEGAECFGLAQLHQFRGRIGRGAHESYCFLIPSSEAGSDNERLKTLVKVSDGFALAEKDMALRGPGEFFGIKQSGMPDLAMASLADMKLVQRARMVARTLLYKDPALSQTPILKSQLERFAKLRHFE